MPNVTKCLPSSHNGLKAPHYDVEYLARDFQLSVEHFPASLNRGVEAQKDDARRIAANDEILGLHFPPLRAEHYLHSTPI